MRIPRSVPVAITAVGCCLALSGTAFAGTGVSTKVGPVAIPSVPISVCVSAPGVNKCTSTPPAQSVTLEVKATTATPTVGTTPPTITQINCPAGTEGAAAEVATGSASVTVSGSASVTLSGQPPVKVPVAPTVAQPGKTVTVYACTGAS